MAVSGSGAVRTGLVLRRRLVAAREAEVLVGPDQSHLPVADAVRAADQLGQQVGRAVGRRRSRTTTREPSAAAGPPPRRGTPRCRPGCCRSPRPPRGTHLGCHGRSTSTEPWREADDLSRRSDGMLSGGSDRDTMLPASTTHLSPTVTPGSTITLAPSQVLALTTTSPDLVWPVTGAAIWSRSSTRDHHPREQGVVSQMRPDESPAQIVQRSPIRRTGEIRSPLRNEAGLIRTPALLDTPPGRAVVGRGTSRTTCSQVSGDQRGQQAAPPSSGSSTGPTGSQAGRLRSRPDAPRATAASRSDRLVAGRRRGPRAATGRCPHRGSTPRTSRSEQQVGPCPGGARGTTRRAAPGSRPSAVDDLGRDGGVATSWSTHFVSPLCTFTPDGREASSTRWWSRNGGRSSTEAAMASGRLR